MKIVYGDIFSSDDQVLVNPVNTAGVMGAGLAKEFKRRYPEMFLAYRQDCKDGYLSRGEIFVHGIGDNRYVLCFPTKHHWTDKSSLHHICARLAQLVGIAEEMNLRSFAFPALGCGLGGLDWESQVKPAMQDILDPAPFESTVYLNGGQR